MGANKSGKKKKATAKMPISPPEKKVKEKAPISPPENKEPEPETREAGPEPAYAMKPCHECKGKGFTERHYGLIQRKCDACNGTGFVEGLD